MIVKSLKPLPLFLDLSGTYIGSDKIQIVKIEAHNKKIDFFEDAVNYLK